MTALVERLVRTAGTPSAVDADPAADAVADAALRQFELFGVSRSTMDQISRRAKIARVTLYRRFPSRDALVEAVLLRELRRFLADLDEVVSPLQDPKDKLVEGFVFTLDAIRGHRLLQRLLESEPEAILPHLTVQGGPSSGSPATSSQRGWPVTSTMDAPRPISSSSPTSSYACCFLTC